MRSFKNAKIVILPTNEAKGDFSKERIYPCLLKHSWMFDENETGKLIYSDSNIRTPTQLQHLYIISDDEIKENNTHFYNPHSGQLHISGNHTDYIAINKNGCKKIIATTDVSLGLPQPSQQFIQKYIEGYNKGNVITDVLVEYNCGDSHCSLFGCQKHLGCKNESIQTVKINPKDNTITIKKVKDSYTREEVEDLCRKAFLLYKSDNYGYPGLIKSTKEKEDKWIGENL